MQPLKNARILQKFSSNFHKFGKDFTQLEQANHHGGEIASDKYSKDHQPSVW